MTDPTILINEYQEQSGAIAEPTGDAINGRTVTVYNSTLDQTFLFVCANGVWRFISIDGVVME